MTFKCPHTPPFGQNREILDLLVSAGICNLLKYKTLLHSEDQSSHLQQRQAALREVVEYYLWIPNKVRAKISKYQV